MEIRQLEHFAAVAKHLSFTRAARDVHVVQSSLSTSVQALERELKVTLFERTTRRVVLTAAGSALLPKAQRILMEVAAARQATSAITAVLRGQVSVGTIQVLTWVDLPAVLGRFQKVHPGVEIRLYEAKVDELLDELLAGDLDFAYLARDDSRLPAGVSVLATQEEELVIVVGPDHPLSQYREVFLPDLHAERFVKFEAGAGLQRVIERLCAEANLHRRINIRVSELELVISLVKSGLGIAILPARLAERSGLNRIRIAPERPLRTVALVAREPGPTNPAAVALLHDLHGDDIFGAGLGLGGAPCPPMSRLLSP